MYPVLDSKIFSYVPKQESLFPDRSSQLSQVPDLKSQTTRKSLILNHDDFFLDILKNLNSQKFVNLFILELSKVENPFITVIQFFRFARPL